MRTIAAPSLVAAALLLATSEASGTIQMGIIKNREVEGQQLRKRASGTVMATLGNAQNLGLYYANVTIGTPAQPVSLQIDTGSSDVWAPSARASFCNIRPGCYGGTFSSASSSTFQVVGRNEFNISYVDGSGAAGDYFTDAFSIGGASVNNFEMGLASSTSIPVGIMGIGYNTSEANVFTGNKTSYPNLPDALVNAGLIPTQAYSLWLDDIASATGSILFGGIDTKRYHGSLSSVMVYPSSRGRPITSFIVAFTSFSATSSSGTDLLTPSNYAIEAILDSGTTVTLLPDALAGLVFDELDARVDKQLDATVVRCSLAKNSGTFSFGFGGQGGPVIKVPVSELVLPLPLINGKSPTTSDGSPACQLGIEAAGNLPILFGDTFLRSAYVVYDLANNRIALAQTDFNSTGSNIVPFASQGAAIPDATTATGEASLTQTTTAPLRTTSSSAGAAATGATTLMAASGFRTNAGNHMAALDWSRLAVIGASMTFMTLGGGFFTRI